MMSPQVVSYPERIARKIPLPYWLTFLVLWESVFLVDYLITRSMPDTQVHLGEFACLILFFAFVCISIIYCSHVLNKLYEDLVIFVDHDVNELKSWYNSKLAFSYSGWWPLVFAFGFAVAESLTAGTMIRQLTPEESPLYYFRAGYEVIGFFVLGLGIWALINVLLIPISLTSFRIKVSVNQIAGRGLQALGAAYLKMALAISFTFIPLVIGAIVSPLIEDMSIMVWLAIGTTSIFCFFLLPQIGVHRIMSFEKQQRLLSFSGHLELALEQALREPSSENMNRLKDLFELQTHLKGMNEWPFNVNTIWQLVTALLIPIVLAILEVFF